MKREMMYVTAVFSLLAFTGTPGRAAEAEAEAAMANLARADLADDVVVEKIRRALIQDHDLSMDARKVQVTAHEGTVTLKGRVSSVQEKKKVISKATDFAAAGKPIQDRLTLAKSTP